MPLRDLFTIAIGYLAVIFMMSYLFGFFLGYPIFINLLFVDTIGTICIFGLSLFWRNSSWYDAYWSVIPPVLLLLPYFHGFEISSSSRMFLIIVATLFWAIRLTFNWVRNWSGFSHEDWRYISMKSSQKTKLGKVTIDFLGIHLIPTLCVFIGLIPAVNALYASETQINPIDLIAFGIIFIGVMLQIASDQQMFNFRQDSSNKGKTMQSGFWFYSRHPNYFGELMFWLGLCIFGFASQDFEYINFLGIIVMYLLIAVGSVKMMDDRSLKSRADFASYADSTPKIWMNLFKKRF